VYVFDLLLVVLALGMLVGLQAAWHNRHEAVLVRREWASVEEASQPLWHHALDYLRDFHAPLERRYPEPHSFMVVSEGQTTPTQQHGHDHYILALRLGTIRPTVMDMMASTTISIGHTYPHLYRPRVYLCAQVTAQRPFPSAWGVKDETTLLAEKKGKQQQVVKEKKEDDVPTPKLIATPITHDFFHPPTPVMEEKEKKASSPSPRFEWEHGAAFPHPQQTLATLREAMVGGPEHALPLHNHHHHHHDE
jgi:hypothetical protein